MLNSFFVGAKTKWKCKKPQAGFKLGVWIAGFKRKIVLKFDVSI
jgi:hypothetical protein